MLEKPGAYRHRHLHHFQSSSRQQLIAELWRQTQRVMHRRKSYPASREYKGPRIKTAHKAMEMKELSKIFQIRKAFTVVRDARKRRLLRPKMWFYGPDPTQHLDPWTRKIQDQPVLSTTRKTIIMWGSVNGTDYQAWLDSHIPGTAAVRAGKITFEKGGLVTCWIYPRGKKLLGPCPGSAQFGVTTSSWNIPVLWRPFIFNATATLHHQPVCSRQSWRCRRYQWICVC